MSSLTWHACPPGGDGLISHRSHRPCPCFFVAGTHYAAKSWPRAEVPRVHRWRGRSLGLVKHRDASESHPQQLSQDGWYGGNSRDRERKREEGRWAGEERGEKSAGTGKNRNRGCPTHPLGWDSSELCWLFLPRRKENRSPMLCSNSESCGVCVSTRAATLSAHGLLAGTGVYAL